MPNPQIWDQFWKHGRILVWAVRPSYLLSTLPTTYSDCVCRFARVTLVCSEPHIVCPHLTRVLSLCPRSLPADSPTSAHGNIHPPLSSPQIPDTCYTHVIHPR